MPTKIIRCCMKNCKRNVVNHRFPKPDVRLAMYNTWLEILNDENLLNLDPFVVYRNKRICSVHFDPKYLSSSNCLYRHAVPLSPVIGAELSEPQPSTSQETNVDKHVLKTPDLRKESTESLSEDQPETGVKRSATTTEEEEIPSKQAKIQEQININEQTQDLITIEENPITIQEEPVDDEVKISETIRRLELVRKQRQNTSTNRKPTMSEEMGNILQKAVVLDLKKCYNESLVYYQKGIEMLCNALKSETNEPKKEYLKNKIKEYLGRAEKIKELLKQQAKYHEQITIENNSTGHSYEKLFKKYLDIDVETVKVEDPYIRLFHQCQNFLMFCELLVKSCVNLKKIYLITSLSLNHTECVDQQQWLNDIKASLLTYKIQLDITYSSTLHDRQILLSNGWIIKIGRGLDFFKKSPGKFCIGNSDYDLRLCAETSIDIFHQENVKQSFG